MTRKEWSETYAQVVREICEEYDLWYAEARPIAIAEMDRLYPEPIEEDYSSSSFSHI